MAPRKTCEERKPEWARLVRSGLSRSRAAAEVGVTPKIYRRWSKELGFQRNCMPSDHKKRRYPKSAKLRVLDRFLASPIGSYPNWLADYNAASA